MWMNTELHNYPVWGEINVLFDVLLICAFDVWPQGGLAGGCFGMPRGNTWETGIFGETRRPIIGHRPHSRYQMDIVRETRKYKSEISAARIGCNFKIRECSADHLNWGSRNSTNWMFGNLVIKQEKQLTQVLNGLLSWYEAVFLARCVITNQWKICSPLSKLR